MLLKTFIRKFMKGKLLEFYYILPKENVEILSKSLRILTKENTEISSLDQKIFLDSDLCLKSNRGFNVPYYSTNVDIYFYKDSVSGNIILQIPDEHGDYLGKKFFIELKNIESIDFTFIYDRKKYDVSDKLYGLNKIVEILNEKLKNLKKSLGHTVQ